MSTTDYDVSEKRQEIRELAPDPKAKHLGRPSHAMQTDVDGGTVVFQHLNAAENPEAWITATGNSWVDIEAYGASEYTKRTPER